MKASSRVGIGASALEQMDVARASIGLRRRDVSALSQTRDEFAAAFFCGA
jgi:hypothetical protein